ncbi:MAG: NOP5/NOP56 family protein [Candidatus Micrarchaeota archaeon]
MSKRFDHSKFVRKAKAGVKEALTSPDHILVQAVSSVDELNKISNLAYERLTEWYGLHFPEFKHRDPVKYTKIALILDRTSPDEGKVREILGESANSVLEKAKNSVGVKFSEDDMGMLRSHAEMLVSIYNFREKLEEYQNKLAEKLAPNISLLAGPGVTAKLIAQAGSLKRLASFPSSTIQVLGAEKALFKHLKSGSPPPKHGLIFQHPLISTAPKKARGKLARALAAKIAIATKADAYSHNSIAGKLKEQFDKRANAILQKTKEKKK